MCVCVFVCERVCLYVCVCVCVFVGFPSDHCCNQYQVSLSMFFKKVRLGSVFINDKLLLVCFSELNKTK